MASWKVASKPGGWLGEGEGIWAVSGGKTLPAGGVAAVAGVPRESGHAQNRF